MASKFIPNDVFIAYNRRDKQHASEVAETLRSHGLAVFFDAWEVAEGNSFEDAVWDAMAECFALVLVLSEGDFSSWMAFEFGAAKAWNKPVYVVATSYTVGVLPAALQGVQVVPLSRIDEIAQSILRSKDPVSENDQQLLGDAYRKMGVAVDQLGLQPKDLGKLVKEFNKRAGKNLSGDQVMGLLFRLRKRQGLPPLAKRARKSAT